MSILGMGDSAPAPQSQQSNTAKGLKVQTSVLGKGIPVIWGRNRIPGNLIWTGDFVAAAVTTSSASGGGKDGGGGGKGGIAGGGGKGGSGGGSTSYSYSVSVAIGLCEGPIASIGAVWANTSKFNAPSDCGLSVLTGGYSQSAWSYLTTNHPSEALNYRGIAYVAGANLALGGTPTLAQYSFEVQSTVSFGGGINDANPKDILNDLITNVDYGMAGAITLASASLTQYSNYCVANGLFLSPVLDASEQVSSFIERILAVTNSTCAWLAPGELNLLPYGDKTITGNGATFTPNLTPQYDLTDDDFIPVNGVPVNGVRDDPADAYNQLKVEGVDRANDYNPSPQEWKDQGAIDRYGLKPAPNAVAEHGITDPAVASKVAQLIGRRQLYVRNGFSFRLPLQYYRLEAGDLVTVTDTALNLTRQLVRLTKVDYGDVTSEYIDCQAEEVLVGTAAPAAYGSQTNAGYIANFNAAPGSINTPVMFDAPGFLTDGFEVWAAVSGSGANWGGCEVWASSDGNSYKKIGLIYGGSRFGVLTAQFLPGLDPDTTHTCSVDLTTSRGSLTTATQADADNGNTYCLVDNEVFSYQTAQLTAQYKYDLKTYLRRGIFNTVSSNHDIGARFVRLDESLLKIPYDPTLVGSTLFLKFPSFNKWGAAVESLASVTAYPFTLKGPLGAPNNVTAFAVSQNGAVAIFQWNLLPQYNISGYEIRYNPANALDPYAWDSATPLTQVTKGTQITTAKLPPGSWICLIKAVDDSQKYSLTAASYAITMVNTNVVVSSVEQSPDWLGPIPDGKFVRHPSGVLIPESTKLASQHTKTELFEKFVPYPVASCLYNSPEFDTGFDATLRIHEDITSALGRGVTTGVASPVSTLDYRPNGGTYHGYQPWTIGSVLCRFFKGQVQLSPASVGDAMIQKFAPTADSPATTTTLNDQVIAGGGTVITFAQQYHSKPNVQATMSSGSSSLTPVITALSTTQCTINVFNSANTSVGGTVNVTITGT